MGCSVVITDKGDTREYFEDHAFYCDPGSPVSILEALKKAAREGPSEMLRAKILSQYIWPLAARKTLEVYKAVLDAKRDR
jgi:glycosyltransferase involved in cell wall biosynthesis